MKTPESLKMKVRMLWRLGRNMPTIKMRTSTMEQCEKTFLDLISDRDVVEPLDRDQLNEMAKEIGEARRSCPIEPQDLPEFSLILRRPDLAKCNTTA